MLSLKSDQHPDGWESEKAAGMSAPTIPGANIASILKTRGNEMKLSNILLGCIVLASTIFIAVKATRAEVVCDNPSSLDTRGPIRPNQHCRRIAGTPVQDTAIHGPWEAATGGACQAYSGLYRGGRVYWRKCLE